jgi:hypothetical protein
MIYSIYHPNNGQILRIVTTNNIESQIILNEQYIEGSFDDSIFYIENGIPIQMPDKPNNYYVFDYTTKQWVIDQDLAISEILPKRNSLLLQSDWTQIPNNPFTSEQQAAWATYRQELRDIPEQSGYPYNVVWPTPPQG